ncbi:MAG: class I SAM-dependent DNA methyltransferase [Aquihabitans sp.]
MPQRDHQRRTQAAYDLVAEDYARVLAAYEVANRWDRAVLHAYADVVAERGGGTVADLGCGTGRMTAHLRGLGLDVVGLDLSPGMLAVARRAHPDLACAAGTMAALPFADHVFAGAIAWYSIIHKPPADQGTLFDEVARVVQPGGQVLVAFQVGDECVRLQRAYGRDLDLDAHRLDPDGVAERMEAAGLAITARTVRRPIDPEPQDQAYLSAEVA